jgi:hypothetical protein
MAAKISLVLHEIRADLRKAEHAFDYAPAMNAPYVVHEQYVNARDAIRKALDHVDCMHEDVYAAEATLSEPWTHEDACATYWQRVKDGNRV